MSNAPARSLRRAGRRVGFAAALAVGLAWGGSSAAAAPPTPSACKPCIQAYENFLASDAMQGRGSGTHDELVAATYLAAMLHQYGVAPAALDGSYIEIAPTTAIPPRPGQSGHRAGTTASVVGVLRGSDPAAPALLLDAHLDHLGMGAPFHGDKIYNGADDDASGCAAVLEMARVLAAGKQPRRTVYFVFFGSEEAGGFGAKYFRDHPPIPLTRFAANIEFEMLGWPDPKVAPGTLWLTGWERSNLGPALAAHGADLVADPHPEQDFFERSDNIDLARAGVVAQTVSSFGLQPMYHRPDDDLAHLDVDFMTNAISSLMAPIEWLANSDFEPAWVKGGQPGRARVAGH